MANIKKNATADTSKLDPKVIAYLDEDIQNKAEFAAQKEEDFKQPYDLDAILEVRHMRKTFPLKKSLLGIDKCSVLSIVHAAAEVSANRRCGNAVVSENLLCLGNRYDGALTVMSRKLVLLTDEESRTDLNAVSTYCASRLNRGLEILLKAINNYADFHICFLSYRTAAK